MNKLRYSEKNYLCRYDLNLEFFNKLGIKVNDVTPLRKVFILSTDEGNKILKRVDYDCARINFISECLDYIKKDYPNIISFEKLKNGLNYFTFNDENYILMDILDGREASYTNPVEIELCSQNIALMHKASKGLRQYLLNKYNIDFLDNVLSEKVTKAYDNLKYFKSIVGKYKYKNEFDELFMDNVDKYLSQIEDVVDKLEKSNYDELRKDDSKIVLCHNDLAYHNFLVKNKEINIIDFDYCSIDLRIIDIAGFILKSIKNAAFDMEKMINIISAYEKINSLETDEKKILPIILEFPKDFYDISESYYLKKREWEYEVFLNRLKTKIDSEIYRAEFLNNYSLNI